MKMLELRKEKWKELCHEKVIPLFLQQLHQYAMSLKVRLFCSPLLKVPSCTTMISVG